MIIDTHIIHLYGIKCKKDTNDSPLSLLTVVLAEHCRLFVFCLQTAQIHRSDLLPLL